MANASSNKFAQPKRTILLIEVERYCCQPGCLQLNRIGLTKPEAAGYTGFECARCEKRNADVLTEKDAPEWWDELAMTNTIFLPEAASIAEPPSSVNRLSDEFRPFNNSKSNGEDV